jgi:hypothetical protein
VKEDEMGRACTNGEKRGVNRLLAENPKGRRPLRRPRCRWINIITMHLGGWHGMDWIDLTG